VPGPPAGYAYVKPPNAAIKYSRGKNGGSKDPFSSDASTNTFETIVK
jgi:hypothetical protein